MTVKLNKLDTYRLSPAETNLMQKRKVAFWDFGRLHSMTLFLDFVMESDCLPGWQYIHHNPNNYALEIPLAGELTVVAVERRFRLTRGDALLLLPGEYNRLETPERCRKLSFGLLGRLLIPTIPFLFGNRTFFRRIPVDAVSRLAREAFRLLERKNTADVPRIAGLATELLIELHQSPLMELPASLAEAVHILEYNFRKPLRIEQIAREVGLDQIKLEHLFRHHLGTTPRAMLTRLRMEQAGAWLRNTDMPVKEIAFRLGYSSPTAFSQEFRRQAGCSPSNVRREQITPADEAKENG